MSKIKSNTLARLIRLKAAAYKGDEALHQEREAVARELLGPEFEHRDRIARQSAHPSSGYLTPYEATRAFAEEIHRAIAWHATNIDRVPPPFAKYDPDTSSPAMFTDVWEARELCDQVGMPYAFFAQQAVMHWETLKRGRLPRPTQLCAPDVMGHVGAMWADPWGRLHDTLPGAEIDGRFNPDNYKGDSVQMAVLAIIDQRVDFASGVGMPVEDVIASVLNININEEEARRRYGDDAVDQALSIQARRQAERDDLVRGLRCVSDANANAERPNARE
jgi:hypothetical protein